MKQNKYQIVNGTSYKKEVSGEVIRVLEEARLNSTRIQITYGDCKTGKVWAKEAIGYVGQSNNHHKLPIILPGKKSCGGECIMDASILEIREVKTGQVLYKWVMDINLIVEEVLVVPEEFNESAA